MNFLIKIHVYFNRNCYFFTNTRSNDKIFKNTDKPLNNNEIKVNIFFAF